MIKPEKSPKFPLKVQKIPQNTLKIWRREMAERAGLRLRRQGRFFQLFDDRWDFWLIPLCISGNIITNYETNISLKTKKLQSEFSLDRLEMKN